ncbi:transposase Tn3 family protein [Burkholderia pseudomallei]|nr:transposase Tn3 family protein [Burkholderia pseudomallei]VCK83595.1 transposase Tn3 family protein [Burkholderia pseudomallei]VCK86821.1 transposase Tn3 family protein [Burkholderia pseudomallei]VCK87034.1 transposase Tn3 family protein [Burkholderia pseudomallei]VCK88687.1 transposase Tn3 family protein [Burkholderia pseudomallei]
MMDHWRLSYLGLRHFPQELTEFELNTFFTFAARERALIDGRRSHLYRLAVALHLGFVRMTGRTLDAYKQVPKRLWQHLGEQLGIDPPDLGTLRALYDDRTDTLTDHQKLAYEALGFRPMAEHQRRYIVRWLKERLSGRQDRSTALYDLKQWLYEHRILIVHDRALRQLIVQAVQDVEVALTHCLEASFGDATLDQWGMLLPRPESGGASLQQWLWSMPLRNSTNQMGELFRKIDRLTKLGVNFDWPAECNEAVVRYYARRCANRPPSVSKRIRQPVRRLEAACFMRYAICVATDQLLWMLSRWLRKVVNEARSKVDATRPDLKSELHHFATEVKALAMDTSLAHDALVERLVQLADATLAQSGPSRASLVRTQFLTKQRVARAMLAQLLKLPFESQTPHPVIDALEVLRTVYVCGERELPVDVPVQIGRAWQRIVEEEDRVRALLAFEWATLSALRVALRNGSVFVDHSFAFRSQATLLIPDEIWKAQRNHCYGHLKLPQDPKEFLGPVCEHLNEGFERLGEAVSRGQVRVDTAIHLDPASAQRADPAVEALRRAIFDVHPDGQLPRIILEIDSETRFSWLLLGREPRSRGELLMVYAAVLAHGTSMAAAEVARMVPELSAGAIRQMMQRVADERVLRQAADAVLGFMHRHPVATHFGRADLASSDMMSLETTRTVWQARADPRRRTASIGVYTHVRDRWGIFYDQPIVLNERQAGAAIEGVIRQEGTDDVAQLAVDTHGFTDFAMGLARALGFDLCPRLAHLRDRRLHVPVSHAVPDELTAVVDRDVRLDAIEAIWDDFVRIAASVQSGHCTAVQALTRFGSAARGQPLYDGGVALGRLFRTIFLIDYFTMPAFRAELQHVLNRGEALHTVQRAIHQGRIPAELTRHRHSIMAVSSALSLLTNAVLAWNTVHMQQAVDRIEALGQMPVRPEYLRRIAPTYLEGINLRGTFDFPVADFAHRLMPSLMIGVPMARSSEARG